MYLAYFVGNRFLRPTIKSFQSIYSAVSSARWVNFIGTYGIVMQPNDQFFPSLFRGAEEEGKNRFTDTDQWRTSEKRKILKPSYGQAGCV